MRVSYPFLTHLPDGSFVRAGSTVGSLTAALTVCSTTRHLTPRQLRRAKTYARAIRRRLARLGYIAGWDYMELGGGLYYPMPQHAWSGRIGRGS